MHMADALLSPAVGVTMTVVSTAAIAYSVSKIKKDNLSEKKIPLMAVTGAMIFAGQMINFSIPGTGSSGHIGGGILLAAMLGGFPALLAIAAVLIIQCLFFADGGLLALGANIFNMGVIPCLVIYPLIYKTILKKGLSYGKITVASIVSVVTCLQLGAFSVVLETLTSGITELPFSAFLLLMQPIHLAIGLAEGIATAAILCFVYKIRPEIEESSLRGSRVAGGVSIKKPFIALAVIALLVGGLFSLFASSNPDGLEWAMEKTAGTSQLDASGGIFNFAEDIQKKLAFLPDYDFASGGGGLISGTTVSGIVGILLTFVLAGLAGFIIYRYKRKRKVTA
jgi:cobalt/nickel transport system permease protein